MRRRSELPPKVALGGFGLGQSFGFQGKIKGGCSPPPAPLPLVGRWVRGLPGRGAPSLEGGPRADLLRKWRASLGCGRTSVRRVRCFVRERDPGPVQISRARCANEVRASSANLADLLASLPRDSGPLPGDPLASPLSTADPQSLLIFASLCASWEASASAVVEPLPTLGRRARAHYVARVGAPIGPRGRPAIHQR